MQKDIIKDLLPMPPRNRFTYVYSLEEWQGAYYSEDERIYVQYYANPTDNVTSLGFIKNESVLQYKRLQWKAESLRKEGYKFREGSVPRVHKYKNRPSATVAKGNKAERGHNNMCESVYPKFKTVRTKRASLAKRLHTWDLLENGWNPIVRSWKRSRKKRQWM